MTLADFHVALAETIAWCAPRTSHGSPRDCLRSPDLRPSFLLPDRDAAVRHVSIRRSSVGRSTGVSRPLGSLEGGRLLAYYPDGNLCDGAAEVSSEGFFDVDNVPPWDTWIAGFSDPAAAILDERWFVVCWAPPAFLVLADAGVWANPEECVRWIEVSALGRLLDRAA